MHGAEGIIPLPLWLALFLISAVIFGYLLFFADPTEGPVHPGDAHGQLTVVIACSCSCWRSSTIPTAAASDDCSRLRWSGPCGLIDTELEVLDLEVPLPCDADGNPL